MDEKEVAPHLCLTMGDPGGIGPEIVLTLLAGGWAGPGRVTVVGDRCILAKVAETHRLVVPWLDQANNNLGLLDCGLASAGLVRGRPTAAGGAAAIGYLERACDLGFDALVTGPINKEALALAGRPYLGHTEWLAEVTGCSDLVMMFDAPELRVALATTHICLADVPAALDAARVESVVRQLAAIVPAGRIGVLGLNPHAGEAGLLGTEEQDWLGPLCEELRAEGLNLVGPLPPDTAFIPARRAQIEAYVALYHDQGLIPLKTLDFDRACQLTLGLPWIRTSVAHGTAHELVGTLEVSTGSLRQALVVALQLHSTEAASFA